MSLLLSSPWLVMASATCALGSATGAIAVGAPLFAPDDASPPLAPPVVTVVRVPTTAPPSAPPPPRHCEVHVDIGFALGSTSPPVDVLATLAPVLELARAHADATLIVDGHADAIGDAYQNLLLSKARAHNVAQRLAAAGLKHHIVERAFGEFAPTESPDGEVERRVRVSIRKPHCQEQP